MLVKSVYFYYYTIFNIFLGFIMSDINIQKTKTWGETLQAYLDRRAIIMLFLGFSAGLPIMLIFSSLSLWLSEAGIDKSTVTMFSWAALGYSFKFIWAPLVDALPLPFLSKKFGRRRSWMLLAQSLIILAIVIMASIDPVEESVLTYMAMGAVLLGFSAATQDIVIDAYRIELAPPVMQPTLSAMYIAGYRIGMIISGAGALVLAEKLGSTKEAYSYEAWSYAHYVMAGIMGISLLTTLTAHEPNNECLQPKKLARNQKYMGLYACTLIPIGIAGVLYIVGRAVQLFFGIDGIINFVTLTLFPPLLNYSIAIFAVLPFALIFVLLQQPKLAEYKAEFDSSVEDKIRLVAVFVISVIGFILAYKYSSTITTIDPVKYSKELAVFGSADNFLLFVNLFKIVTVVSYTLIMIVMIDRLKAVVNKSSLNIIAICAILSCIYIALFKNIFGLTDGLFAEDSFFAPVISFAKVSSHLLSSLSLAIVIGGLLVKVKLVRQEVAQATWVEPIADFFQRYGKKALLLLALIGLYRISDIVAGVISNLFYQDMGFSKIQIAEAVKFVGVVSAILGGFIGGVLSQKIKIMRAMMVGALLTCVTNLVFILLINHAGDVNYLYLAVIIDNLAGGLASAVFVAFLSALTSIRFTAVQYAIFSSLMTFFPKVIAGYSGSIVESTCYEFFFGFAVAIGVPVLLLVWLVSKYIHIGQPKIGG